MEKMEYLITPEGLDQAMPTVSPGVCKWQNKLSLFELGLCYNQSLLHCKRPNVQVVM